MRFSFVPFGSITPRRFRCQPQLEIEQAIARREDDIGAPLSPAERQVVTSRATRRIKPSFTAQSAHHPAYAQLHAMCPDQIARGADDESEMGVWHFLHNAKRETNLRLRLEEYLRLGLEAGLFYET